MRALCLVLLWSAMAVTSQAQTFTTLLRFNDYDGYFPSGSLVSGPGGSIYGVTEYGGDLVCYPLKCGTVFRVTPEGAVMTLHRFCSFCADGSNPVGGLVLASNGNFYGSTTTGGIPNCRVFQGCGTIFQITPAGKFTVIYTFSYLDGAIPYAALIQATNGRLYGTTRIGGANHVGTVFEITTEGSLKTLHIFNRTDGAQPIGSLLQATDGNLYGTTSAGGANGAGTVFHMTLGGALTTLYNFCSQPACADGEAPFAGLVQGSDGSLYGTTRGHASTDPGTIFKITPDGTLTTMYRFCAQNKCADGELPFGGLTLASDGNFYGTTYQRGAHNYGTIFQMTPAGTLTTLHSFAVSGGTNPLAPLVEAPDGNLYGSTPFAGAYFGTIFELSLDSTR